MHIRRTLLVNAALAAFGALAAALPAHAQMELKLGHGVGVPSLGFECARREYREFRSFIEPTLLKRLHQPAPVDRPPEFRIAEFIGAEHAECFGEQAHMTY